MTTGTWDDLVSAALLGTERRTPPAPPRAGQDTAGALLDAAALRTVQRRAALLPAPAAARPEAAPEDPRPPLPDAARRRLALLLADRAAPGGGRRGGAPDLTELLPQWLAAANRHGYRAPAALLPALLEAARARSDLRPDALALGGPRALWLARLNPQWKYALRGHAAGATAPAATGEAGGGREERVWQEGLFAERVAVLASVRHRDPSAAREMLAATWPKERAEDRLLLLDVLREECSPADEPFFEQALSDRSRNVRAVAAELLSTLPGSALSQRMAARARACVALDRTGEGGPRIVVEAPHECDSAMQRDGVVRKPPAGRGERSWWLTQLVEAAPLSLWCERFGVRSAEEAVALPVADGWQPDLHAAWCRAAVRQGDAEWSRVLLGAAASPPAPAGSSWLDPAKLLSALPAGERAVWVADFIGAHGLSEAFRLLGVCAVPWAEPLGRAVVDALDCARDAGGYPWSFSGVMGLAERCLDPEQADRLEALTVRPAAAESVPTTPGADYWTEAFERLIGTLRLRATMRAELAAAG
ncbi:hypothetical protein BLA24_27270 [Streptomyces cinnamoneus]|uniref:Uncharacterized protein n=1 Tax=Streptomyces cinnamoneus TaxID=53446 RepID=A0A2G1XC92_STRCJ|nr:DUF5691 domain-containing protein [Streptomyces cinnamoneus]PHQ48779.1 hypothetical protein BLA24_27270 [Streptomyces cinnamoneus]PPT14572.1 hypothetical protein CYQ11_18385 [Streptomyces cinnamoneus]